MQLCHASDTLVVAEAPDTMDAPSAPGSPSAYDVPGHLSHSVHPVHPHVGTYTPHGHWTSLQQDIGHQASQNLQSSCFHGSHVFSITASIT